MNIDLRLGKCQDVLKTLPENSVDTIITDPPYGLSFMGKKWDYDVPSADLWKSALRVLKPGGTLLCFAGTRTQHRMAVNIEDAGFILKDCIMWLYGSGFPKATDISKQIDKQANAERKVVGKDKYANRGAGINGNTFVMENSSAEKRGDITAPSTDEAKLWDGWKSHGLKPAYEPIIVAMKPNDGTYAENALKWGVSGLNIDGGRIGTEKRNNPEARFIRRGRTDEEVFNGVDKNRPQGTVEVEGRFPANIILDEEAAKQLDEQSEVSKSTGGGMKDFSKSDLFQGETSKNKTNKCGFGDIGGASRFFYCAKTSKKERNAGCENLEEKDPAVVTDFRPTIKSNPENWKTLPSETPYARGKPAKNNHPTVKPIALMEYLCMLTKTPTGGIVLDPFMGSGTTGIAAKNTGRDFIGIEMSEEYFEIAKARINNPLDK